MANTLIQLKYSTVTNIPSSLNIAEPAYSYSSNTLFIGTPDGLGSINIGGRFYTSQIDVATHLDTPNTLVRRDATGNASFNYINANFITGTVEGIANTALALETARDIGLSGDATGNESFDGSSNVTLTVELTNTGVVANTYGGATQIPTFVVDEDGRITSASNVAISTALSIAADDEGFTVDLLTETLTINGRDGITTNGVVANNTVLIDVDNTVIRGINGGSGAQTINSDVAITGNLTVTGNTYSLNVESYVVTDPLIYLAANNYSSDIVDIGFVGNYYDGSDQRHTGVIRKAGTNDIYAFTNYDEEFDTNTLNIANPSLVLANLHTNIVGGKVESLAQSIKIADGGTNANSFTDGLITYFDGTKLASLANTGTAGTYANASHVPVITTDAYGRVSGVTNTSIAIDTAQVTSGTLPIARGGTNNTSYTAGALLINDGTSITSLANTTYVQTGTLTVSNTVSSITVDAYGRLTALTSSLIDIDAAQITSGTLGVARGGTGANTFTTNGVLLGQGSSTLTTVSSSTEGHVLTINSSGVPQFQMISGGTF